MIFYKITANVENSETLPAKESRFGFTEVAAELLSRSNSFFYECKKKAYIFTYSLKQNSISVCVMLRKNGDVKSLFNQYISKSPIRANLRECLEITFDETKNYIRCAARKNFVSEEEKIIDLLKLQNLSGFRSINYEEKLLSGKKKKSEIIKTAEELLFLDSFLPEAERIYQKIETKVQSHPVHYMISSQIAENTEIMCDNLLEALYENQRINSKRVCMVKLSDVIDRENALISLYECCKLGTVVLYFDLRNYAEEGMTKTEISQVVEFVCQTAKKFRKDVLSVFVFPYDVIKNKEYVYECMENVALVEINDCVAFGEAANNYLKARARKFSIRTDKKLVPVEDNQRGYTVTELNKRFEQWYDNKIRTSVYSQYKEIEPVNVKEIKEKPKGSSYDKLNRLVGVNEAKNVINKAINYHKAVKLLSERGLSDKKPSMHMIFTGNPGTAKTTVARLFAQIMKDNGLLSNGELYEVGRADLVGKYVGHTAPLVKRAFRIAKGGVLFIDEAYSLVDGKDGLYGDEAINTLVQEMENNREDTVVIFAGYPDKMEEFLNKNPGLRSRIAYHVPFADYSTDELSKIADIIAEENNLFLTEDAKRKLNVHFTMAKTATDFGNGRFVRNVIEKAKIAQANRLINMDLESITRKDIESILPEDIEDISLNVYNEPRRTIGFYCD